MYIYLSTETFPENKKHKKHILVSLDVTKIYYNFKRKNQIEFYKMNCSAVTNNFLLEIGITKLKQTQRVQKKKHFSEKFSSITNDPFKDIFKNSEDNALSKQKS